MLVKSRAYPFVRGNGCNIFKTVNVIVVAKVVSSLSQNFYSHASALL